MKIVHVEDFVHPDAGYQVNQLSRLQARDGHEVVIVAAELEKAPTFLTRFFGADNIPERDERFFRETGVRIVRGPVYGFYSGRALFHPRLFRIVADLEPDCVFVHSEDSLSGMFFIWLAPFLSYPLIFDSHSLEMGSVHRFKGGFRLFYRWLVAPFIVWNKIPLVRLADSNYVEECLGIPLRHTILLSFGTDTDLFRPDATSKQAFLARHGLENGTFVALYAGKLDEHKGGKFLAKALQQRLVSKTGKPIVFLIVGSTDGKYGQEVEELLASSPNRIIRMPTQRYLDLADIYKASDIALYPRQCSMSFYEAQSSGLPVLFEVNEVNEQRAGHDNALTFEPGNLDDFRAKLMALVDMPPAQHSAMAQAARAHVMEGFDFLPIARQFTEIMRKAAERFKARKARP